MPKKVFTCQGFIFIENLIFLGGNVQIIEVQVSYKILGLGLLWEENSI